MGIRNSLFNIYSWIERVMVPTLRPPLSIYEDSLRNSIDGGVRWLDVGAGHKILPPWRFDEERRLVELSKLVVGLDSDLGNLKKHRTICQKVLGDSATIPFKDGSFDLVSANMVVEHMQYPEVAFSEIFRILRPGGLFIFHTPNANSYQTVCARLIPGTLKRKLIWWIERREEKDVFDTYYKANTQAQIVELAKSTDFQVVKIEMINSGAELAVIPFLAVFELLLIRLLMTRAGHQFRTNIIAVLMRHQ